MDTTVNPRKALGSDVQAYMMRHGHDARKDGEPDEDAQLDKQGENDAKAGATFLRQLSENNTQFPKPDRIVSSSLVRAQQTAAIAADILKLPAPESMNDLREYSDGEPVQNFEARNERAFQTILNEPGTPLVVAHRGTTAFLDKRVRSRSADRHQPDYERHGLLHRGGVLAIAHDGGLTPLFRPISTTIIGATRLPPWIPLEPLTRKAHTMTVTMEAVTKSVEASVRPVDSENPNGEFVVILSKDNLDRDDENLWAYEWMEPLPARIHMDTDHAFAKGMSVPMTAGSGVPEINEDGELLVKGSYAGTPHGQLTRQLIHEKHIWQASVSYQLKELSDGRIVRELLNGTFTGVPCNPEAVVLSSKSTDTFTQSVTYNDNNVNNVEIKTNAPLTPGTHHADPGYLDGKGNPAKGGNGVPRYQLDDASHVRNALARFSQNAAAAKYTPAQRSSVLGRIRSAARKFGIDVSDKGGDKALVVALCKAITTVANKGGLTQSTPAYTPLSDDVGARSVYDPTDDEDHAEDDEHEEGDVAQAIHDAAIALGAACKHADHEHATLSTLADLLGLKNIVQPVISGFNITVAGPPGMEMFTVSKGETVVGHGKLGDLVETKAEETEEIDDDNKSESVESKSVETDAKGESTDTGHADVNAATDGKSKSAEQAAAAAGASVDEIQSADDGEKHKAVAVKEDEEEDVDETSDEPVIVVASDASDGKTESLDDTVQPDDEATKSVTPKDLAEARIRMFRLNAKLTENEDEAS